MNKPTISVCLTVYDRAESVLTKVFDSLDHQAHDQLVVVLDRSPRKVKKRGAANASCGEALAGRLVGPSVERPSGRAQNS